MAARRSLTVVGLAAALMLITPFGTAWAHPGKGHAYGHNHRHAQVHKQHPAHQHGRGDGSGNEPAAFGPSTSGPSSNGASARFAHHHTGSGRSAHTDLAGHPGKARGLFKHTERPGMRTGQQHDSQPPTKPTVNLGEPPAWTPPVANPVQQPTTPPTKPGTTQHDGDHSGSPSPTSRPPAHKAPRPAAVAQGFWHSGVTRFTPLPLIIVSALAAGVCGLIVLARHRA